jgi:hypothetical protein
MFEYAPQDSQGSLFGWSKKSTAQMATLPAAILAEHLKIC